MKQTDAVKLFGLNNLLINSEINRIERKHDLALRNPKKLAASGDDQYYPQFVERLRREASEMSSHYEVFYCLENSIRELIAQRLEENHGEDWWELCAPQVVKDNAAKNMKKEMQSGVTLRSSDPIDYTNFGELGEIIKTNWDIFGDMFRDSKAVERVVANLNTLRGPIAHCKPLAEDEVVRLNLALRDWFRQME